MPGEDFCINCKNNLIEGSCKCVCHAPIFDQSRQEKLGRHEIITKEDLEAVDKTNKEELFEKIFLRLPEAWVSHGFANHSMNTRYDCLDCIDTELFFLKAMKGAGGLTKFLTKEKKKLGK